MRKSWFYRNSLQLHVLNNFISDQVNDVFIERTLHSNEWVLFVVLPNQFSFSVCYAKLPLLKHESWIIKSYHENPTRLNFFTACVPSVSLEYFADKKAYIEPYIR